MDTTQNMQQTGLKRPAISSSREESILEMERSTKRSRPDVTQSGGKRNAISSSYSSSQRWLQRQVCHELLLILYIIISVYIYECYTSTAAI